MVLEIGMMYHFYNIFPIHFTCSSEVTLPHIRKGLVNVTFPSPFQYFNGSLSKTLKFLKVYFRAVYYSFVISIGYKVTQGLVLCWIWVVPASLIVIATYLQDISDTYVFKI